MATQSRQYKIIFPDKRQVTLYATSKDEAVRKLRKMDFEFSVPSLKITKLIQNKK